MNKTKQAGRWLALLLSCLMLTTALLPLMSAAASDKVMREPIVISHTSPAIPADVGQRIDLSGYSVQISDYVTMPASTIAWSSTELTVSGSHVTAPAPGVYRLTATGATATRTVYLVAKDPAETEYVLYQTDFSDAASISEWKTLQKTDGAAVSVEDGKLTMNASDSASSYIRLMLPSFLNDFGDYRFEATGTITKAANEKRYLALMFRIQKNDYPYYQMCVRQNATLSNGTEFAERTEKNAWNVTHTTPHTARLTAAKEQTFAVEATGKAIATSIDGTRLIYASTATKYAKGAPGLQVNGCSATFSSVKVTLMTQQVQPNPSKLAAVREPASNLNQTPSIVSYVNTAEDLNSILTASPATAVLYTNSAMEVTDASGKKISTVEQALTALNGQVIPAFYVKDKATVKAVCAYLEKQDIIDAFIMAADTSLVRLARDTYEPIRGIVDFAAQTDLQGKTMAELRTVTNAAGARVAVIPAALATPANVEALQRLFITVWVQSSAQEDTVELVSHITAGANGIITQQRAELERCFTAYFRENTLNRVVNIIGHRGQPSTGQENSIASSIDAYEGGATMVENDIYLSKDGVVVVMHDSTIDRTTNGAGSVESMTVAALQKFVIDGNTSKPTQPIPTLVDYFEEFKGKDIQLIVEIKSKQAALIQPLIALIKQYDMVGQVNIITFATDQIDRLKQAYPELSVGYLTGGVSFNEEDPDAAVEEILKLVQRYDTTFNPSYASGALGPNVMTVAGHRGVTFWPYTFRDAADFDTYFLYGTNGLTTDYSFWADDYIKYVATEQQSYTVDVNAETPLSVIRTNYDRTQTASTTVYMTVIEGNAEAISYEKGNLTVSEAGEYTVMFRHACQLNQGKMYYKYTQPVTILAVDPSADSTQTGDPATPQDTPTDPTTDPTPAEPADGTTTAVTVALVGIIAGFALVTAVVVLFAIRRR